VGEAEMLFLRAFFVQFSEWLHNFTNLEIRAGGVTQKHESVSFSPVFVKITLQNGSEQAVAESRVAKKPTVVGFSGRQALYQCCRTNVHRLPTFDKMHPNSKSS
jgi:hypothetical protein